jgi:hypothetical protein
MIRGKHQIGYGANWIHGELNGVSQLNATGPFTFNGQNTSVPASPGTPAQPGLGLADFMLGKPSALTQGTESLGYFR